MDERPTEPLGTRDDGDRARRGVPLWAILTGAGVLVLAVVAVVIVLVGSGGGAGEEAISAQQVRFEEPEAVGDDPFTEPVDVEGEKEVRIPARDGGAGGGSGSGESDVGAGPFGGSGSDLVCDRELLIKSLRAQPDRMRAWAGVLGIEPTEKAVSAYIRSLTPVTLTQDTRVTNHTFVDGRAVPLQSVLAAGTAVLVDKYGRPVVRCRCGNPLLEPVYEPDSTCTGCPPRYQPPPPCKYIPYRPKYPPYDGYEYPPPYKYPRDYPKPRYGRKGKPCYVLYPKPPPVKYPRPKRPPPETAPETTYEEPPSDYVEPDQGYTPPRQRYTPPDHEQPEEGYEPPDGGYEPPEEGYDPPPEDPPAEGPPMDHQQPSGPGYDLGGNACPPHTQC